MVFDYSTLLGIVLLLLVGFHYYFKWSCKNYWRKRGIPQLDTTPLPLLGNIWPMLLMRENFSTMIERFYNLSHKHSMVGFHKLSSPAILIRHPDLIKTVMLTNFSSFKDNDMNIDPKLDPLLAGNPFFLSGSAWKAARSQLTAAFSSAKLKIMFVNVQHVCDKLTNYLSERVEECPGKVYEVELKELFTRFTTENVARSTFGVEGNSFDREKDGPFVEMGKAIFFPTIGRGIALLMNLFAPMVVKIFRISVVPKEVDQFFRSIVRDVIRDRKERNVQGNDFLNLMLTMRQTKEVDVSVKLGNSAIDEVTSQALSFFLDGSESSAITLSFVGYDLAANPEAQRKLREEVTSVLQKHGSLTYEALQQMTYMDQVIDESMRLHSVAGGLTKLCTESCELQGPDGLSCRVEPGTVIYIPMYGLHTDSDYWENPAKFDPDRFSDEGKTNRHKFAHLPFGGGPRICVGMRMALMQMKAALAAVVSHYSLEVSPRTRVPLVMDPASFLAVPKGGLWVNVEHL